MNVKIEANVNKVWANKINEVLNQDRNIDIKRIKDAGYDIVTEAKKLETKYIDLTE